MHIVNTNLQINRQYQIGGVLLVFLFSNKTLPLVIALENSHVLGDI